MGQRTRFDRALEKILGNERPDQVLYAIAASKLRGGASQWFLIHDRDVADVDRTWSHLKGELLMVYGSGETKEMVRTKLHRPSETFKEYALALRPSRQPSPSNPTRCSTASCTAGCPGLESSSAAWTSGR